MNSNWALIPVLTCLIMVPTGSLSIAQEKDPSSDNITPIASTIIEFATTIDVDGQKLPVTIPYTQQGNNVFVLPVWRILSVRRLVESQPAAELKSSDLVLSPEAKGDQRLEFHVVDLLENEAVEKAIQDKLKDRIAQRSGQTREKLTLAFAVPQIKAQSYRFALIAPGRGDQTLPAEVPITAEMQRTPKGQIRFTTDAPALRAVEKENGGPIKLAQVHLRVVGHMRVRFEVTQVIAQVEFVRNALTDLRKKVGSIKDSSGLTPEVFVDMPNGGSAESDNQIHSLAKQSLAVTISARSGADTSPIVSMVQSELNGLIEHQRAQVSDENKRLAFLVENQVAITATVGEIKRLAKLDEKDREVAFKTALEDFTAHRLGKASSYSGSLGFSLVNVGGSYGNAIQEDSEKRMKLENESVKRNFDKLMKDFQGKVPTLSGISFDDKSLAASMEQVSKTFKESKMSTGDTLHRWPLVSVSDQLKFDDVTETWRAAKMASLPPRAMEPYKRLGKIFRSGRHLLEDDQAFSFHPDGKKIFVNNRFDGDLFDISGGQPLTINAGESERVGRDIVRKSDKENRIIASGDGRTALSYTTTGRDGDTKGKYKLTMYALATGDPLASCMSDEHRLTGCNLSWDGKALLLEVDGTIELWRLTSENTFEKKWSQKVGSSFYQYSFSRTGRYLQTPNATSVDIRDAKTGNSLFSIEKEKSDYRDIRFGFEDKSLFRISKDDKTALDMWDLPSGQLKTVRLTHDGRAPPGDMLVVNERWAVNHEKGSNRFLIWDLSKPDRPYQQLLDYSPDDGISRVGLLDTDGKRVAIVVGVGKVKVLDVEPWKELATLTGHGLILRASFSPDGRRVALQALDQTLAIWRTSDWKPEVMLVGHKGLVASLAWSPDGKSLATASTDRELFLWRFDD